MVKSILTTAILLISLITSAQVVERNMDMSAGEKAGLQVDLKVDHKKALDLWKDYLKPYGKVDKDRVNQEYVMFKKEVDKISSEPVSIISKFVADGDGSKGNVWVKLDSVFISAETHPDVTRQAGAFVQEFAYECHRYLIREEIKNEEKELKKLNNNLKKLKKKNKNWHKDIKKKKEDIAEWEKEQSLNEQALETLEAGDTTGKDYEKQLKKLRKTKENLINDIANGEKKILGWENDITSNESDQKSKSKEIKKQEKVIKDAQKRLSQVGKS